MPYYQSVYLVSRKLYILCNVHLMLLFGFPHYPIQQIHPDIFVYDFDCMATIKTLNRFS